MTDAPAKSMAPQQAVEATLANVQQDLQQLGRQQRELQALTRQIEAEIQPLSVRKGERSDMVRAIEANPGAYPPENIREAYDSLSDATMRLFMMQNQLDGLRQRAQWLGNQVSSLEQYAEALRQLASSMAEGGNRGTLTSGAPLWREEDAAEGSFARQLVGAQEAHSRQLAQHLQDGPVQVLSNLVLQAEVSQRLMARNPERARDEIQSLKGNLARALSDARAFVSELHPPALEEIGLRPTLRRLAAEVSGQSGRKVTFHAAGQDVRPSVDVETIIYRIAQESLRLALLTVTSGPVDLSLTTEADSVALQVNATGPAQAGNQAPSGAVERIRVYAQALDAQFTIAGPNDEGLRIAVEAAVAAR